jgi:hypothetical protein
MDQGTGGGARAAIAVTGLEYEEPGNAPADNNARMCRRFAPRAVGEGRT